MRGIDVTDRVTPNDVYQYDDYQVILKPKMNLSYAYRISKGCLIIEISDYLQDAPNDVLRELCAAIAEWSVGMRLRVPDSLRSYIMTDDFIVKNRPKYIKRSRSLSCTQQGTSKNLMDSVERLLESELIFESDISNSYISWATNMAKYRFGLCNQTFRVISINPILDSEDVPDSVVDFVVYHEILHLRQDRSKKIRPHNAKFRSWEHLFPDYESAESFLKNIYSLKSLDEDSI